MSGYTLDKDPFIPTGDPATPEEVAAMLVDPESPVTAATIPLLAEWQRPDLDQVTAAVEASPVVAVTGEDPVEVAAEILQAEA
jgi:hypothetical protein